ncbi:MAG TPA: CapA family protein [Bacteroidales bacterium]|nr:CapA family protein [Bacteroidales bacterium]
MTIKNLIKQVFRILVLLVLPLWNVTGQVAETEKRISLLFIGDIMGHDTQIASAENRENKTYDYNDVFQYIKPVISKADVAIANLEVTLAGPPYKGYPQFSSPAELAVACNNAGIDYFLTANNHAADRGKNGIISTLHKLDSLKLPHTGSYYNKAERDTVSPLLIKKNDFTIAVLNYTYATNGIIVPHPVIVDSLDVNVIVSDIQKSKKLNPDAVILFLHWGTEYDTIPGRDQVNLAERLFAAGADMIIGSHPHVLQKMVWTKNNAGKDLFTVYSLGNFVSNQRRPKTDGGSMVKVELVKKNGVTAIQNAGYYLTWVYTPVVDLRLKFYILPCADFEGNPGFFTKEEDYLMMMKFIKDARDLLGTQNIGIKEIIPGDEVKMYD